MKTMISLCGVVFGMVGGVVYGQWGDGTLSCFTASDVGVIYPLDEPISMSERGFSVFVQDLGMFGFYVGKLGLFVENVTKEEKNAECNQYASASPIPHVYEHNRWIGECYRQMWADCVFTLLGEDVESYANVFPMYGKYTHGVEKDEQEECFLEFVEALRDHGGEDAKEVVEYLMGHYRMGQQIERVDPVQTSPLLEELITLRAKLWDYLKLRRFDGEKLCFKDIREGYRIKCFNDIVNVTRED